ncbi:carboxypeptidase regulatory-like domain-containing protein [Streptomyces buecherae]|uniref:MSCRAMM family protein n=1 Tax=Streptomyces buecherae TaxID=2763006 RepID=UPI003400AE2F
MHAPVLHSVAVTATALGALTWAPAASAEPSEATSTPSTAPARTPAPDTGSVEITVKDTAGHALPAAAIVLVNSAGQEAGGGQTDSRGRLSVVDLAPGIYRLKETSSGSSLHQVAADQDVIVTPGATTRLTLTNSFKAARLLLQVKDDKTGKPLRGATVNVGTGTSTLLTLNTGTTGMASADLPMTSRSRQFWSEEAKAPAGYDLDKLTRLFTARPGTPVTVTITNSETEALNPDPSDKPTHETSRTPPAPADKPDTGTEATKPFPSGPSTPRPAPSSASAAPAGDPTHKAPTGSLAHTGADATSWMAAGAGCLVVAGAITLIAVRRRSSTGSEPDDSRKTS